MPHPPSFAAIIVTLWCIVQKYLCLYLKSKNVLTYESTTVTRIKHSIDITQIGLSSMLSAPEQNIFIALTL